MLGDPQKQSEAKACKQGAGTPRRLEVPLRFALLSELAWDQISHALNLPRRELETLRGVFDDDKEATIAARLAVSEHTVHSRMNRLFRKLGVTTRAQMVLRVMQELLRLTVAPDGVLPSICRLRVEGKCPLQS